MQPPSYWKSIDARNDGQAPALVEVSYGDDVGQHHTVLQSHMIRPGEHFAFPEETYNEGGWESVAPVHNIVVTCLQDDKAVSSHLFEAHPASLEAMHGIKLGCDASGRLEAQL